MNTKNVYLLVTSISLCAIVMFLLFFEFDSETTVLLEDEFADEETLTDSSVQSSIILGYGWSEIADDKQAIDTALKMMESKVANPSFILVFYSGQFDPYIIQSSVQKSHQNSKLLGMESSRAVFSPAGLHNSASGSVVVLGFSGDNLSVGVAGKQFESLQKHKSNVSKLIGEVYTNADVKLEVKPTGILSSQVMGYSELYCESLNESFSSTIPMIGGNSITADVTLGSVIVNDSVYTNGYALALFFSDSKIGADFHGGFSGRIKYGIVTAIDSIDNHIIREIDNKPAFEVYNHWADGKFSEFQNISEPVIVNESVLTPLSKAVRLSNGELHHVTLHPWKFNPDGSINGGVMVNIGDSVYYVEGSEDVLIKRSGSVAKKAMVRGNMSYKSVAGGVHIYCIGAGMQLGLDDSGKAIEMVKELNKNMNGQPFIGGFFGGEQGCVEEHGFYAGNLMSAMMTFSNQTYSK